MRKPVGSAAPIAAITESHAMQMKENRVMEGADTKALWQESARTKRRFVPRDDRKAKPPLRMHCGGFATLGEGRGDIRRIPSEMVLRVRLRLAKTDHLVTLLELAALGEKFDALETL